MDFSKDLGSGSGGDGGDTSAPREIEAMTEEELRRLSKQLSTLIPKQAVDREGVTHLNLELLLERLLHTANKPRLHPTHRNAVCNALSTFLEQGLASSARQIRDLCLRSSTVEQSLSMYLERSNDAQPKPMRQVLLAMVKIFTRRADAGTFGNEVPPLEHRILRNYLKLILADDNSSFVKPAMNVLEVLLGKKVVTVPSMMNTFSELVPHKSGIDIAPIFNLGIANNDVVATIGSFVETVLSRLEKPDLAPAARRLLLSFFKSIQGSDDRSFLAQLAGADIPLWSLPLKRAILQHPDLINVYEHHILPDFLRLSKSDSFAFLKHLPLQELRFGRTRSLSENELRMCLMVAKVIYESQPFAEPETSSVPEGEMNSGLSVAQEMCLALLDHLSASVRIAALSLFVYSSSTTRALSPRVLLLLRDTLPRFHMESDAKPRIEFISIVKRLCIRVQAVAARLRRNVQAMPRAVQNTSLTSLLVDEPTLLQNHADFVKWYVRFLCQELRPTASYQRHITGLKILQLFISSNLRATLQCDIETTVLMRLLMDLIVDSFDDVRCASAALLRGFPLSMLAPLHHRPRTGHIMPPQEIFISTNTTFVQLALARADLMMRDAGRADYADGVGRITEVFYDSYLKCTFVPRKVTDSGILRQLVFNLEQDIQIARTNLRDAVLSAPIHGRLIALRYIVGRADFSQIFVNLVNLNEDVTQQWQDFHSRILESCGKVWEIVKPVLCVDSPEGHVDAETEDDELDIGIKDTLSFSWRALKEASSLMNACLSNLNYGPPDVSAGMQYADFRHIGTQAFTQLAELRHRGAFSAVSQTFATCCLRCAASEDPEIRGLPSLWYQETLLYIQEQAFALTRRSAGLPSIITGILVAFPNGAFFDQVICDLQAAAKSSVDTVRDSERPRLPQVHALNCLKDIFTNTRLGLGTEIHLPTILVIAVDRLQNEIWAIRNCGLMLLKALLTRMSAGTASSAASHGGRRFSKLAYDKYPNLSDLVVQLLHKSKAMSSGPSTITGGLNILRQVEIAYPAMEVIERIGIPYSHRPLVRRLLFEYLDSPVWNMREKAAKTLSYLTNDDEVTTEVRLLLQAPPSTQNATHGRLLYMKHMLQNAGHSLDFATIAEILEDTFDLYMVSNGCFVTATTYLNILLFVLEKQLNGTRILSVSRLTSLNEKVERSWTSLRVSDTTKISARGVPDAIFGSIARLRLLLWYLLDILLTRKNSAEHNQRRMKPPSASDILSGLETQTYDDVSHKYLRLLPLDSCLGLLEKTLHTDSKALVMDRLAELLVERAFSVIREEPQKKHSETTAILADSNRLLHEALEQKHSNNIRDSGLRLRGSILSLECAEHSLEDQGIIHKLRIWIRMLRLASEDKSELSTRLSSASSIWYFREVLRPRTLMPSTDPSLLGVYLALYDTLVDDEEEVRESGATTVSWLLSKQGADSNSSDVVDLAFSSVSAVAKLMSFLIIHYRESLQLSKEAFSRVMGCGMTTAELHDTSSIPNTEGNSLDLEWNSVESALRLAVKRDTTLFVEEKHNLYVDPVQEAERWARVLNKISVSTLQTPLISQIEDWTLEGLASLTRRANANVDGPLGWSSKSAVFVLGMRVLLTAQILVEWEKEESKPNNVEHIRDSLRSLLVSGKESALHGLWLEKIGEILT